MPSIRKVRVSNVLFDNNTRFYDDIIIPVNDGKLLIEADNGTGKTLLMQCVLQAARPNLFFPRKNAIASEQPTIKNLFRSNDNTTMHSMIEWTLDEENKYDYMLTGFCAKKVHKDSEGGKISDITYYNYVIIYNEDTPFSIDSIPLKVEKDGIVERISYSKLQKFLKELAEKDKRLLVKVFKNKSEYEVFLNSYNINSSEFELMRHINGKEGGSEDYFTEKYKTPYDFISGELINRIENVDKMRLQTAFKTNEDLAKSLFEIKSTMEELKHKQNKKYEIEVAERYFYKLIDANENLISELEEKQNTFEEVAKAFNTQVNIIKELHNKIEDTIILKNTKVSEREEVEAKSEENDNILLTLEEQVKELNVQLEQVKKFKKILKRRSDKKVLLEKVSVYQSELDTINNNIATIEETSKIIATSISDMQREEEIRKNENIYIEYLDAMKTLKSNEKKFELISKNLQEIINEEKKTQEFLLYAFNKEIDVINGEIIKLEEEVKTLQYESSNIAASIDENKVERNTNKKLLIDNENKINDSKNLIKLKTETHKTNSEYLETLNIDKKDVVVAVQSKVKNIDNKCVNTEDLLQLIEKLQVNAQSEKCNSENMLDNIQGVQGTIIQLQNNISDTQKSVNEDIENKTDEIKQLEKEDVVSEYKELIDTLKEANFRLEGEKVSYEREIEKIDRNICEIHSDINKIEDALEDYYNDLDNITPLLQKHLTEDRFELDNKLNKEVDDTKKDLFKIEDKINEISATIFELEMNKGVSVPEDTKKCYEVLSNVYSSAALGMNFSESLTIDDKNRYLSLSNLIPIGIILNNVDYNNLLRNKTLLEKIDCFLVPIVNIDKIKNGDKQSDEVVYISAKDKDFYINEEKRKLQIEELKKTLSKLEKEESIIGENLDLVLEELNIISKVNNKYPSNEFEAEQKDAIDILKDKIENYEKNIKNCEEKISQINNSLEDNNDKIKLLTTEMNDKVESIKRRIQNLHEDIRYLNIDNNDLSKVNNKLSIINTDIQKLETIVSKEETTKDLLYGIENEINNVNIQIDALEKDSSSLIEVNRLLEEENTKLKIQLDSLLSKIVVLNEQKVNVLAKQKVFLDEIERGDLIKVGTVPVENNYAISELRNELKVIRSNKNNQGADIDMLEENIQACKKILLDKKDSINTDVISFEELENKKNTITKNNKNVFDEIKRKIAELKNKERDNKDKLELEKEQRIKYNTLKEQASIDANNINTNEDIFIPEDYNPNEEETKVKTEINKLEDSKKEKIKERAVFTKKIKIVSNEISKIEDIIHKYDKDLVKNDTTKEDILKLMENNNISQDESLGLSEKDLILVSVYERKIAAHNKALNRLSENHTNLRRECLEKLRNTAFDIITVLENIEPKYEIQDVKIQNNLIKNDCLIILKQIGENLEVELEELNNLKEDFIEKCLEKSNNLLNKIKSIQKLTTIEQDGVKRALIKVNLHELDETKKKEKMEKYINTILGQINTDLNDEDVNKQNERLSAALASNKLLEQVIINQKRCEVKIYIPKNEVDGVLSNGSYTNWGSTASGGQRNIMYLTVSIAMLLFIRELSSVGTAAKQQKVLYVDGAFKASASIHLWECIYPLLVDNKIQLIVTNMGTSPTLMKMFESVALLKAYKKQLGDKSVEENKISQKSTFKADHRTLKTENILHSLGEYKEDSEEINAKGYIDNEEELSLI